MNKKLLLVSLLSVGMLVGCGGGDTSSSSEKPAGGSTTPSAGESVTPSTGTTSEEAGGTEEVDPEPVDVEGKKGLSGYYLVGEMNDWNGFWKYSGYDKFKLASTDNKDVFTLVYSVGEDLLKDAEGNAKSISYKVMYWDGNGSPSKWYPDGIGNDGKITEAGEYTFTFNRKSTETAKKDNGESYTLYTKAVKTGDFNPDTAFPQGDKRKFEASFAKVTYRVVLEKGLELPEGTTVILHAWGQLDTKGNKIADKDVVLEKNADGDYIWAPDYEITVDEGTDEGLNLGFNIIVADKGWVDVEESDQRDWTKKVGGDWSIHVGKNKHNGSVQITKADRPYWVKGIKEAPFTVEEAITEINREGFDSTAQVAVEGKVTAVTLDEEAGIYDLTLEAPASEGKTLVVKAAAKLNDKLEAPAVGDTVKVFAKAVKLETEQEIKYAFADESAEIYYTSKPAEFYFFVRGGMNGWNINEDYKLAYSGTPKIYTATVSIEKGQGFKVGKPDWNNGQFGGQENANKEADNKYVLTIDTAIAESFNATSGDVQCLASGDYTFTLDLTGEKPVCTITAAAK